MAKASAHDSAHNQLAKNVIDLPGVSEKTAQALAKANIESVFDLLLHVPKTVVEQNDSPGFRFMEPGRHYVVAAQVVGKKISGLGHKKRLEAILQDETGRMSVVFFGPAVNYAQHFLKENTEVRLRGEAKEFVGRIQMVHPKFIASEHDQEVQKLATYAQTAGLNSAAIKRIVDKALSQNLMPADHMDDVLLTNYKCTPLADALKAAHCPDNKNEWDNRAHSPIFRRLAFEEILSFYVRLYRERGAEKQKKSFDLQKVDGTKLAQTILPFSLTAAQKRVIEEIIHDMSSGYAMARLLQGDVGSGKTAVSAVVALFAANHDLQVAVMAPTEILASQLYDNFCRFFNGTTIKLALLTAQTKGKARKELTEQIACGHITIVVGTHALLSNDVTFNKLGLVVIDEQHRFGVKQRTDLLQTTALCPHLLVMSATPIPRSLALTLYGDLELSVIDEKPPGRLPIHTQLIAGPILKTLERLCERIIATEQKAFIVFPLIEESEHLDLEHAKKALILLQEKFGAERAALLHGKLKPEEKNQAMHAFKEGQVSFLVATTVVEVGVDIPDASCMLIIHPERFGLAQLHQLRGRVGRKDIKSFCFLITDLTNKFGTASKRLNALCTTQDGFKLAEIDLEIRGPGELLGIKQSGFLNFLIFNHTEFADLITPAKTYAKTRAHPPFLHQKRKVFLSSLGDASGSAPLKRGRRAQRAGDF